MSKEHVKNSENIKDNSKKEVELNDSETKLKEETNENNIVEYTPKENKTHTFFIKNNKKIIRISIICVLIIIAVFVLLLYNSFTPYFSSNIKDKSKEKIELKYTETINNSVDGVNIIDVSEVVEEVMPSIVAITSKTLISSGYFDPNYFGTKQYSEGAGSGIIISKSDSDILILTNNHVIADASELSVQFINEKSYDAKIVGISERKDIAIISVSLNAIDNETLESIKIATIGNSDNLKVGNGIIAIGNALGYGQSVTTGVVSALNREVTIDNYTNKMIQIDAAINGGNSGGALLNSKGEVVGINSAKYSSSGTFSSASVEGMGFAIPITDVSNLITSLMNGENDSSPSIGIEGYITEEQNSHNYNIPSGFYISKIASGSGADRSDLEIGNIITQINGNKVTSLSDIQDVLYELKKGDVVTLTISYVSGNGYKEKEVKVTLS